MIAPPVCDINGSTRILQSTIHLPELIGDTLNRTHGTQKNLNISLFLLTIFGPIYFGPPYMATRGASYC